MKKTVISAEDYELYRILLPWKYFFTCEKQFILGELEKMHPRFSGNCCYDTKYLVQKKNLFAEVVVMEKASLERYKSAGGELYLEYGRRRSVFSQKSKIVRALSLVLVLIAGILSFRIAKSLFFEAAVPVVYEVSDKATENDNEDFQENQSLLMTEEKLKAVFNSISIRGGKLSSFSYERNQLQNKNRASGEFRFSVHGCNSEDVASAKYCVVSFRNNEPYFDLVLPFETYSDFSENFANEKFRDEEEHIVMNTRNQLKNLGASIESEHNGENSAEFSFVADYAVLYSCLKICGENAERLSWQTKKFSLSGEGGRCRVQASFAKGRKAESFNPILICAQNAFLFGQELKLVPKKAGLFSPFSSKPLVVREKVGEVRKNGAIFTCYKTIDGKISFERRVGGLND